MRNDSGASGAVISEQLAEKDLGHSTKGNPLARILMVSGRSRRGKKDYYEKFSVSGAGIRPLPLPRKGEEAARLAYTTSLLKVSKVPRKVMRYYREKFRRVAALPAPTAPAHPASAPRVLFVVSGYLMRTEQIGVNDLSARATRLHPPGWLF